MKKVVRIIQYTITVIFVIAIIGSLLEYNYSNLCYMVMFFFCGLSFLPPLDIIMNKLLIKLKPLFRGCLFLIPIISSIPFTKENDEFISNSIINYILTIIIAIIITYIIFIVVAKFKNRKLTIRRLLAIYVDYFIICMLVLPIFIINTSPFSIITSNYKFMLALTPIMILILLKDLMFRNASLGKKIFRLEIRTRDDQIPSKPHLIIRNIFIVIWPLEVILIIFFNKRMGDIIFKTQIVNILKEK